MNSLDREELEYEKRKLEEVERWPMALKIIIAIAVLFFFYGLFSLIASRANASEFEVIESSTIDKIDVPMQWRVQESTEACSSSCDDVVLAHE